MRSTPMASQSKSTPGTVPLRAGEVLHVTGPAGSGKSRLLAALAGVDELGASDSALPRIGLPTGARAGLVLQDPYAQVVFARVAEQLGDPTHAPVPAALTMDWDDTRDPHSLSPGELWRLHLATQLAIAPQVLALDEPEQSLDSDGVDALLGFVRSFVRSGASVVWASVGAQDFGEVPTQCLQLKEGPRDDSSGSDSSTPDDELPADEYPGTSHDDTRAAKEAEVLRFEPTVLPFPGSSRGLRIPALRLRAGEWLWLSAPNGAGKTTLMRRLAGLDEETPAIHWRDDLPASTRGFLWQRSVSAMVAPSLRKELEREGRPSEDLARELGIEHLLERDPLQLGRGDARIAAIACELARGGRILLLDEPFAGLDAGVTARILRALERRRQREGLTVIATTHQHNPARGSDHRELKLEEARVDPDPRSGGRASRGRARTSTIPAWLLLLHAVVVTIGAVALTRLDVLVALASWNLAAFAWTRPSARATRRLVGFFALMLVAAFLVLLIRQPAPEAIVLAGRAVLKTLCLFLPFRVLVRSASPGDLLTLFKRILPARLALLLVLALQQVPLLAREAHRHREALKTRGAGSSGGLATLPARASRLVLPLILLVLSTADRLAVALHLHPEGRALQEPPERSPS
jgi:energy-coupling factor transport system ATP-binding protein